MMTTNIDDIKEAKCCPHHEYSKGFKCTGSADEPDFMRGQYYPGDEPGILCKITGNHCDQETDSCKTRFADMRKTQFYCPECEQHRTRAYMHTDGVIYGCPECGASGCKQYLVDEYEAEAKRLETDAAWIRNNMLKALEVQDAE